MSSVRAALRQYRGEIAAFAIIVAFLALVVVAVVLGSARDERAATPVPGPWAPLSGPDLSVGGATVWTRCDGYTRLYLTVGADGFPTGPVTAVPDGQGAGCSP